MTIPTTIPTGGHPADREMTELQKAVIALLGGFSSDIVKVANGGTGLASYAAGDLLYATAATVLAKLAKQTDGQLLALVSGLPAWAGETSWTNATLAGTWTSNGLQTPGYIKDANGCVRLRGNVTGGGADTIFTLAAGYRPSARCIFATDHNGTYGRINVLADGTVSSDIGANPHTNVGLEGVIFDTR